jgi:hypothetical protein
MFLFIRRSTYVGYLKDRTHCLCYSSLLPLHIIEFWTDVFGRKVSTKIFYLIFKLLARSESHLQRQHPIWYIAVVPNFFSADRNGTADTFLYDATLKFLILLMKEIMFSYK